MVRLYSITIKPPSSITHVLYGSFTTPTSHDLLIVRGGHTLELYSQNNSTGQLHLLCRRPVYCTIRSITQFRLSSQQLMHIGFGTDSGRLVILCWNPSSLTFKKIHQETFGRSGVRRVTPGQYVVAEPKGRAIMIGSLEKEKFVYVLNQTSSISETETETETENETEGGENEEEEGGEDENDSIFEKKLTISSPLSAHKGGLLCMDLVSLDTGYENPCFGAIETSLAGEALVMDRHKGSRTKTLDELEEAGSGNGTLFGEVPTTTTTTDTDTSIDHLGGHVQHPPIFYGVYELDLGINHVLKRWQAQLPHNSHSLIPVPGGKYGPGGVLVCSGDCLTYVAEGYEERPPIQCFIPRVEGRAEKGREVMIVAWTSFQKRRNFFFLISTEFGDLFRVSIKVGKDQNENEARMDIEQDDTQPIWVQEIRVSFFDSLGTVPVDIAIMNSGYFFVASEFGDHFLYYFESIGSDDGDMHNRSDVELVMSQEGMPMIRLMSESHDQQEEVKEEDPPRRGLKHLSLVQTLPSTSPLVDFDMRDLYREGMPQLFGLCGRGKDSSFRIIRQGMPVTQRFVCPIEDVEPVEVWSVAGLVKKKTRRHLKDEEGGTRMDVDGVDPLVAPEQEEMDVDEEDEGSRGGSNREFHRFVLLSIRFREVYQTMVFEVVKSSLTERKESRFLADAHTLDVFRFAKQNMICQVHTKGVVLIRERTTQQWDCNPSNLKDQQQRRFITCCCRNTRQLVISLTGGELVYFEINGETGHLDEIVRRKVGEEIACIAVSPVPTGRVRAEFLAVGYFDRTVRVFSISDPSQLLHNVVTRQALPHEPSDVAFLRDGSSLGLHVGLGNGLLVSSLLDTVTGTITDSRTRLLGAEAVRLCDVSQGPDENWMLAVSTRSWLFRKSSLMPLAYVPLRHAASFRTRTLRENGVVCTAFDNSLRFVSLDQLDKKIHEERFPLSGTPRKMVFMEPFGKYVIIEADYNARRVTSEQGGDRNKPVEREDDMDIDAEDEEENDTEGEPRDLTSALRRSREYVKSTPDTGRWVSSVRLFDPHTRKTTDLILLDEEEAAFSVCCCQFEKRGMGPTNWYVVVGTCHQMTLFPRRCTAGFIRVFHVVDRGNRLVEEHRTLIQDVPLSLIGFEGRLLVGVRNLLRLYDIGSKRMLLKCENRKVPTAITQIEAVGSRIFVADAAQSMFYFKYKRSNNSIVLFADNFMPRFITRFSLLDFHTLVAGDKFGNVFFLRLDRGISEDVATAKRELQWLYSRKLLGAPHKAKEVLHFFVGDVVTSIRRAVLLPGAPEVLLYTTVSGAIGAFVPFRSRQNYEFFEKLEGVLREESPPLLGTDHFRYRSSFNPCVDVIDGDFCEEFLRLRDSEKEEIAVDLEVSSFREIEKRIDYIKHQCNVI